MHDVFLALLKHAEAETVLKAGDNSLTSPGIPGLDQLLEFQELGHTDTNNSQFQLVDRFGLSFASPLELVLWEQNATIMCLQGFYLSSFWMGNATLRPVPEVSFVLLTFSLNVC